MTSHKDLEETESKYTKDFKKSRDHVVAQPSQPEINILLFLKDIQRTFRFILTHIVSKNIFQTYYRWDSVVQYLNTH